MQLTDREQINRFHLQNFYFIFFLPDSPLVGLGLLIHEVCFLDHTQRHTTVGRTRLDE